MASAIVSSSGLRLCFYLPFYGDSDYDDDDVNDDLQRTDATGKGECLRFTETIFNINLTAVIETDWYCSLNS